MSREMSNETGSMIGGEALIGGESLISSIILLAAWNRPWVTSQRGLSGTQRRRTMAKESSTALTQKAAFQFSTSRTTPKASKNHTAPIAPTAGPSQKLALAA